MADTSKPDSIEEKLDQLYEMAGLIEEPRDKDLMAEAKWLIDCQFRVIVAACEKYGDDIANWEPYVNQTVLPRVVECLKEKWSSDKAMMGDVIQDVVNVLQKKLESDKTRINKLEDNIQMLGGVL